MTTASPQAVLAALREDLEPSPISKRLPTIIQLAAHLQLVAQQIAHEATILVGAFDQLRAQGVQVAPEQLNALMRLAARDNDELFDLSMDMRIEVSRVSKELQACKGERGIGRVASRVGA